MPFCPNCQVEYRPGFKHCTDCDVDLVDALPVGEPEAVDNSALDLVELATFQNSSEAQMIRELLEENDINAVLRGPLYSLGYTVGLDIISLLVKESDLPEATRLYEDYFAGIKEEEPEQASDAPKADPDQT
jgi:hypothetical protein